MHRDKQECRNTGRPTEAPRERIDPSPAETRARSTEEQLLDLLRAANRVMRHRHGGKGGQQRILATLARRGTTTQRELMELFEISSASMSEILGKLEAKGLVERHRSEEDKRLADVALTEAGRAAVLEAQREREEALPGMFSCLDDGEKRQLADLLGKLVGAWQAEYPGHKHAKRGKQGKHEHGGEEHPAHGSAPTGGEGEGHHAN